MKTLQLTDEQYQHLLGVLDYAVYHMASDADEEEEDDEAVHLQSLCDDARFLVQHILEAT